MRIPLTLAAALAIAGSMLAQTAVLPAAASQWRGRWVGEVPFFHNAWSSPGVANEARTQLLYSLSEIPSALQVVQSLAFREVGDLVPNPGGTIELDVQMSLSSHNPDQPSHTFAQNAGPTPQQVFLGTLTLPAEVGGTWPRPWNAVIPLQAPFVLAPAPGDTTLVIDIRCWNSTVGQPWTVEVYDQDVGLADTDLIQMDCYDPTGAAQASWTVSQDLLVPGGSVGLLFYNYPANQPSLQVNALALGFQGTGGTYLGTRLPFPLATFGIPAPTNCRWDVEVIATVPMQYVIQFGMGGLDSGLSIPIPNLPNLIGQRLFAQDAGLMQYPAGLQVFPSAAVVLTIRSGAFPVGSFVSAAGNRMATTGLISTRMPISVELR